MRNRLLNDEDVALDGLLCFAIYSAGLAFGRVYRPLLKATGLTYVQYVVMVALWGRDDRTVGDLCDALYLTTSTLTPVLQKLERKGFLRRVRGPDDERQVHVLLTRTGADLRAMAQEVPNCIRDASGLDESAMRDLRAAVTGLRDRLLDAGTIGPSPPAVIRQSSNPRRVRQRPRSST